MNAKRRDERVAVSEAITRRHVLKHALFTGALGVLPFAAHAGSGQAPAQSPRSGGTLKMAWASAPRTLDPALTVQADEYMITQNVYDNLTRVDERFQPQPMLAERWSSDTHGQVWTFQLRKGVKFHHGREFTSRDVAFTFERIMDPKTGSSGRTAMGPIEKVEPLDDYTVRFQMAVPYADFPVNLGVVFGRILPADRSATIASDPSGTGPFRLAEFRPGERTRMVRFADYWDKPRPYLDELWQVNVPQYPTQVASLSGGDVQMVFEVPVPLIGALERSPSVSVIATTSTSFQPIVMQVTKKPFEDNRVRLAMKHALNRQAIIKAIWQGRGVAANDHPVPEISPYWAMTPERKYDIARAKMLLAEAGYPQGLKLVLWTSNERVGMQELAVVTQQLAAPAGIRIEIRTVPWSVYIANVWKKEGFYVNNYYGRATIDETLYPYYRTGGSWNEAGFSNPEIDRLLDAGRSTIDPERRRELYAKVQAMISDEGPHAIAYFSQYVTAMRREVKGYVVHPLRWCDFRTTYLES